MQLELDVAFEAGYRPCFGILGIDMVIFHLNLRPVTLGMGIGIFQCMLGLELLLVS